MNCLLKRRNLAPEDKKTDLYPVDYMIDPDDIYIYTPISEFPLIDALGP